MNESRKDIAVIGALALSAIALAFSVYLSFVPVETAKAGSLEGDYATTTTSAMASATATTQLKNIPGALGNVVVSSSSPITTYSQITIYDATTTMATSTSKVLARFGAGNQTHGTYQFDIAASYGLKMEVAPGYSGNASVTWR